MTTSASWIERNTRMLLALRLRLPRPRPRPRPQPRPSRPLPLRKRKLCLPFCFLCLLLSSTFISYSKAEGYSARHHNAIPRSNQNSLHYRLREAATAEDEDLGASSAALLRERPPWNPSPQIDDAGFCRGAYRRIPGEWEAEARLGGKHQDAVRLEMVEVRIRQVPGDGNCLFHSISTCMAWVVNGTQIHYPGHLGWLYRHSASLRQQAVDCLRHKRKTLFLQGNEHLRAHDLVEAAANQYGISAKQYCDLMQQDSYWGGGPEIVALSNVLKRPIHVYELASRTAGMSSSSTGFVLRRMACFGSPKFDKKEPFHILSADSRFPDVSPGKQLPSGNHFLAVFPVPEQQAALEEWVKDKRRRWKGRKQANVGSDGPANGKMALEREDEDKLDGSSRVTSEQTRKESASQESVVQSSLLRWWRRILFLE